MGGDGVEAGRGGERVPFSALAHSASPAPPPQSQPSAVFCPSTGISVDFQPTPPNISKIVLVAEEDADACTDEIRGEGAVTRRQWRLAGILDGQQDQPEPFFYSSVVG